MPRDLCIHYRVPPHVDANNYRVFQSNFIIFQVLSVIVRNRISNATATLPNIIDVKLHHTFLNKTNATQPIKCWNHRKSTYHAKNSRSNIKFQEFSRSVGTPRWQCAAVPITVLIAVEPCAKDSTFQIDPHENGRQIKYDFKTTFQ